MPEVADKLLKAAGAMDCIQVINNDFDAIFFTQQQQETKK